MKCDIIQFIFMYMYPTVYIVCHIDNFIIAMISKVRSIIIIEYTLYKRFDLIMTFYDYTNVI